MGDGVAQEAAAADALRFGAFIHLRHYGRRAFEGDHGELLVGEGRPAHGDFAPSPRVASFLRLLRPALDFVWRDGLAVFAGKGLYVGSFQVVFSSRIALRLAGMAR